MAAPPLAPDDPAFEQILNDVSEFGRAGIPSLQFNVGAVNPARYEASRKNGAPLPSLHSSEFAPDREPTLKTGVASLTVAALELLGKS